MSKPNPVTIAISRAKAHWGAGWANLTPDMRNAYVCQALVGILAGTDYHAIDTWKPTTDLEVALFSRLTDLEAVFTEAVGAAL